MISLRKKKLDRLRKKLKRIDKKTFFLCKNEGTVFDYEAALEYNFKCPECGNLMVEEDETNTIKKIKEKINALETELGKKTK
jgi:transcription initiation factor TFIIE subunit alpha